MCGQSRGPIVCRSRVMMESCNVIVSICGTVMAMTAAAEARSASITEIPTAQQLVNVLALIALEIRVLIKERKQTRY